MLMWKPRFRLKMMKMCLGPTQSHRYPQMRSAQQEYFEYTPGVLRAFVRPAHLDSLTFTLQLGFQMSFEFGKHWQTWVSMGFPWVFLCRLSDYAGFQMSNLSSSSAQARQPVFERKMGVKFIWGEVPGPLLLRFPRK